MTELETLADETKRQISNLPAYAKTIILDALVQAYALGRASVNTPARVAAAQNNGRLYGGRKAGSKDSQPRVRRTREQIKKDEQKEMKP